MKQVGAKSTHSGAHMLSDHGTLLIIYKNGYETHEELQYKMEPFFSESAILKSDNDSSNYQLL